MVMFLGIMFSTAFVLAEEEVLRERPTPRYDVKKVEGAREAFTNEMETRRAEMENKRSEMEARREEMKVSREEWMAKMKADREAFVEKLKTDREAFKQEVENRKEEWKQATEERKAQFCEKSQQMLDRKFEFATKSLENAQERISNIIVKLVVDEKITTDVQAALNLSIQKLDAAKTKLAEIKTLIPKTCVEVTPELFKQIKILAREAKDLMKESRESIHDAVKAIHALRDVVDDEEEVEEEVVEEN